MSKRKINKTMTKEQCELATSKEVVAYVKSIARRFGKLYPSVGCDEFFAEGMAAVCEQAMLYDPQKDASFLTYFTMYVNGSLAQYVERNVMHKYCNKHQRLMLNIVSIEDLRSDDDDEGWMMDEKLSAHTIDDEEEKRVVKERLDTLIEELTEEEREIIAIRYGFLDNNGETLAHYLKNHNMLKSTFYAKVEAIEVKLRRLCRRMAKK